MTQSCRASLVESVANTAIGWTINFGANLAILPAFGFNVTPLDAAGIGVIFTGISIARGYVVRRVFNRLPT